MRIDLYSKSTWDKSNLEVKKHLGLEETDIHVMVFRGLNHALMETTGGLVKSFPHKIKGYFFKNMDPYLELPMIQLAKEGFDVEPISFRGDFSSSQKEFLEGFQKNSLFTLLTHHDPLFSRKYKTEELFQHLNEQKHFVLQIYHNQPPSVESIKTLGRFQGYIVSINSQLAVAFLGARLKFSAPITSGFVWSDESTKRICEGLIDQIVEDKDKIEKFENSGTANSLPLLIQQERVYDRAIIHWKDMDSHALLQYLKQEELKETGYETEFESASLTRWGGFKSNDWLIQQGFKNDDLRGTLIIDVQQISESLSDKICQARQYILELQGEE